MNITSRYCKTVVKQKREMCIIYTKHRFSQMQSNEFHAVRVGCMNVTGKFQ